MGRFRQATPDSVPSIPAKEPNSRADWRIPLEQVEAILQPSLSAAETKVTLVMRQFVESIESQILSALKQAAMDIIEHLGKEAAMRVLVAERKAALFEQELINTKQEALAMLLRLKHSMDAQIMEAEGACQIERRRTQEMEAKLVTSQDTVKKLKAELKRKGEVLEKMQKVVCPLDDNCLDLMHSPSEYSTMQVTSSAKQLPEHMLTGKLSLPSIIMKCKEQQIPANGYNQGRYRETAIESTANVLPLSEGNENKECKSTENDLLPQSVAGRKMGSTVCFNGQTDIPVTTAASLTQEYHTHARPQHVSITMAYPCAKFENTNVNVDFEDINSLQKQNAGCFLSQNTIFVTSTGKSCTLDGGSVHLGRKTSPTSESDASLGVESKLAMTDTDAVAVRNAEKQNDSLSRPDPYSAAFLLQDREASAREAESSQTSGGEEKTASSTRENLGMKMENKDANGNGLDINKHVEEKGNPEVDFSTSSKLLVKDGASVQSTLYSSPVNLSQENIGITLETTDNRNDGEGFLTGTVQNDGNKARLSVGPYLTEQQCDGAILASMPSVTEGSKNSRGEMTDIDVGQGPDTSLKAPEQQAQNRLTRFTFQRKRRRESPFQQNGNLVQEEKEPIKGENKQHEHFPSSLSGKSPQKHRMVSLASQKPSLVAESSRDSRRLMQGARQLISLSEKKSW